MASKLKTIWQLIRRLSGDDAYGQYLKNHKRLHQSEQEYHPPLSKAEFFKQWQDRKWDGIKRCC